jgi:toxin ParE1/3/4
MREYRLSPLASEDLDGIYDYTFDEWGVDQVRVYHSHVEKALEEVTQDPIRLGSKARDDLVNGCRSYRVEHHYLFYRIRGDRVEVGRVLHEAMNFEEHLSEGVF